MRKTKNLRKRIIAVVLSTILCLASSVTALASNETTIESNTSIETEVATVLDGASARIGNCVGSDGVIASGYGCTLVIHLDQSYFDVYIRAGATGNANNTVSCHVTLPNGYTYPLGYITADGSKTSYLLYDGTAPAGDYIFTFEGTDAGTTGFLGFIYD